MADVKAQFPIGKTQWSKWNNDQRTAFNEARAAGVPFADAVAGANQTQATKKKNVLDVLKDVAEAAETVADVATTVAPVVGIAKSLVKATKKKGK